MRLIFFIVAMALAGIGRAQHDAGSLQQELQLHPQRDSTRAMILNRLSYVTGDPQQAKSYADEALAISQEKNFKKGIGHAYYQLSQYYWKKTDSNTSIDYAFKALRIFEECMPEGISVCYSMIGLNLAEQQQMEEAIRYHRLALLLDTRNNNTGKMASDYNNIGNIYHDHKRDYDSAIYYYNKSLELVTSLNNREGLLLAFNNLGSAYSLKGDHVRALDYLQKASPLAERLQNQDRLSLIHQTLGEIYARMKRYDEAKKHFELALTKAQLVGNKRRKTEVYGHLREMELSRKNYEAAYRYLNELAFLKDTVYSLERSAQIVEIQTQYETEKKAQQIKVLEHEKQLQTLWRNVLIVGMVLLAAGAFVFYRYRSQKAKELLNVQLRVNEELSAIDKLKSQLYNNVAHEFRTPLTLILAPIENELRKASSADKENLLLIRRSATRLLQLINQLLDLSKLESGKMTLRITEGSLHDFLEDLMAPFNALATNKHIEFTKVISLCEQPYWFDSDVLEKIISNLLANAFKFTPASGKVTVEISSLSDALISISVADTGHGIPQSEQGYVFSPFYQVQGPTGERQPGTGLGLAMVKELVKLCNGTISLSSTQGVGTTFQLTLPIAREAFAAPLISPAKHEQPTGENRHDDFSEAESEMEESAAIDPSKGSILLVEDNADLRTFIRDTLKANSYQVLIARDGKEGLAQAQQIVPTLVLSDVMMPGMDGIELTKHLKKDERTSHIPVILLTARNEQGTRLDGLKTGADDYLTKPFSPQELLVRIDNLIEQRKKLSLKFRERILVQPSRTESLSLDDKFLLSARRSVEDNISDPALSVDRLSEELNLSRTQLFRKMKALTSLSPNDFIKNIRLQRAAEMIVRKTDTISQIGYAVGFRDQSYFTKCFKKQFGVTPGEYAPN